MRHSLKLLLLALVFAACNSDSKNPDQKMGMGGNLYPDTSQVTGDNMVDENEAVITTRKFFDALKKKDGATMNDMMDENLNKNDNAQQNLTALKDSLKSYPDFKLQIMSLNKEGAAGSIYATVNTDIKSGSKTLHAETVLRKSNLDSLADYKIYSVKVQ